MRNPIARSGDELTLEAMESQYKRLARAAEKVKREVDERCSVGSELIAVHEEFVGIVQSGERGAAVIEKLGELQRRQDRARRVMKKDVLKLLDKQSTAELERDNLLRQIQQMSFRLGRGHR